VFTVNGIWYTNNGCLLSLGGLDLRFPNKAPISPLFFRVNIMKHAAFNPHLLLTSLVLTICSSLPQQASAHRPIFTDAAGTNAETAIQMGSPDISQVVYRQITKETPEIWLTFSAPKEFALFIQVGVPVIDRLKDFRPAMAVIGPGLPNEAMPFPVPDHMGAKIFSTQEVEKPRFFHEHFTNTDSWILRSETVKLTEPGRYYLVAFSPKKQTGKLWLSIGKKESFNLGDLMQFPVWKKRVQEFHEVGGK
jgi:hypothetical protein